MPQIGKINQNDPGGTILSAALGGGGIFDFFGGGGSSAPGSHSFPTDQPGQFVPYNPNGWQRGPGQGPFPNSKWNNPFGITQPTAAYGRSPVFGGPQDLMKSVATRNLAINAIMGQMGRQAVPSGLEGILQGGAGALGGRLGAEQQANNTQALTRGFTTSEQDYQQALRDLASQAYLQGGALWGGQAAATAAAKQQDVQRRLQHKQSVLQIIQGIGAGLGAGGGIGGMGGGGGGGGGGDMLTNLIGGIYATSA